MAEPTTKPDEFETFLTDELICPYCGYENYDEQNEPDGETTCTECEQKFTFIRDYTIRYISSRIPAKTD